MPGTINHQLLHGRYSFNNGPSNLHHRFVYEETGITSQCITNYHLLHVCLRRHPRANTFTASRARRNKSPLQSIHQATTAEIVISLHREFLPIGSFTASIIAPETFAASSLVETTHKHSLNNRNHHSKIDNKISTTAYITKTSEKHLSQPPTILSNIHRSSANPE